MTNLIITIGWFGLGLGLVYAFFQARSTATEVAHIQNVQRILLISGAVLVSGYVLKFLSQWLRLGFGRCKTCGKKIEKQEMFCFDHSIAKIRHAQDLDRTAGGGRRK